MLLFWCLIEIISLFEMIRFQMPAILNLFKRFYELNNSFPLSNLATFMGLSFGKIMWNWRCAKILQICIFSRSPFSHTWTEYGDLECIFPYLVWLQENADQKIFRIWILFTQRWGCSRLPVPKYFWKQAFLFIRFPMKSLTCKIYLNLRNKGRIDVYC